MPAPSADICLTCRPIRRQGRAMTDASTTADTSPDQAPVSAKEEAVDTIRFLALLAIAVLIFRSFFLSPFNIPSESMQPRLLIGDYLLVNKMAYGYSKYSLPFSLPLIPGHMFASTEERRVGKWVVSPVRSRWWPVH